MSDTVLPKPDPEVFARFLQTQAQALRAQDEPPPSRPAWEDRRARLREAMFKAMGPFPETPCPLEPKPLGFLERPDYCIEKLIFQSRPDVWVTANAYVPSKLKGKVPAVLVVHGHWPWARRDDVVQARCLGLVQLGFFVLAVDAFGAGERYTTPGRGTYHGALYGSTLWPVGQTLLGMQVYDNRRAVDYLRSRPEVDGDRLGITGASGGGNQSMYAGALDDRFRAVVPVCSVGTYQAYLRAACCVCELLPGALRFTEEGDVLGLVAPRSLLVINATRDAFQFSVGEAEKSVARARHIFKLYGAEDKLRHATFDSPHDYNQAMRETMYGWMTRWLKDEGDGKPIPEPKVQLEKQADLSCFSDGARPKGFLFPPSFAAREARGLLEKHRGNKPSHVEDWESTAVFTREQLRKQVLGGSPKAARPVAELGEASTAEDLTTTPVLLEPEPGLPLPVLLKGKPAGDQRQPLCVLLHLGGKAEALAQPLAKAFWSRGWLVAAPDLRGTGETKPAAGALGSCPDHNSAEHALWIGRPLLGQWIFDVSFLLDWLALQPGIDRNRIVLAGIDQAGVIALLAAGLFDNRTAGAITVGMPTTYVTEETYGPGTYMGLLAPGILRWGDLPQLAGLVAPRRLVLANGITPQGKKLTEKQLRDEYEYVASVYKVYQRADELLIGQGLADDELVPPR